MNGLFEAAREVSDFMRERDWKFCLIGGLAVQHWGEPRTTLDADFTLLTGWGVEAPYVKALLGRFESRISDAHDFALSRRILLLKATNGTDIDVALGALPFEEIMIERSEAIEFGPGIFLPCCTAEDLFIMKAFAGRPRDWQDARGVYVRKGTLDVNYILHHLTALCELRDDKETLERVKRMIEARE